MGEAVRVCCVVRICKVHMAKKSEDAATSKEDKDADDEVASIMPALLCHETLDDLQEGA